MELCFADFQTTVLAFQAIAIHPGGSTEFLVSVLESFLVRCCLWMGRVRKGSGGVSPPQVSFPCIVVAMQQGAPL